MKTMFTTIGVGNQLLKVFFERLNRFISQKWKYTLDWLTDLADRGVSRRERSMAVTLKDVAKRAGVSIPTVSLIINGRPMAFKDSTRAAVLAAVESLNYRPDSMARRNATGSNRRDAIGLLLRSESISRLANTPVYEFICGVNDVLMEHNQFLVMMKLHQLQPQLMGATESTTSVGATIVDAPRLTAQFPRPPRVIAERFVDGLIVETGLPADLELAVARYRIPTIWLNSNHHDPSDCIYPDEMHAGRLVTEHLIGLGHRQIAFFPPAGYRNPNVHFSVLDRQIGYEQAMAANGLPVRVIQEENPGSLHLEAEAVAALDPGESDDPVTGIVTYGLGQALKLQWQLPEIGLNCPADVSIVAVEDLHYVRRAWPNITGCTCDRYQMGSQAAKMMLAKIQSDGKPQPSQVFKGELIIGETSAAARVSRVRKVPLKRAKSPGH
jgi:DNA-binding LacI/PurR family transcriptional regulator